MLLPLLFHLIYSVPFQHIKIWNILAALPKAALFLTDVASSVYLVQTFKYRNGTNSENNLWRNLMNQQKYFRFTISIQVLVLNETSRVVNENIGSDGRMNSC